MLGYGLKNIMSFCHHAVSNKWSLNHCTSFNKLVCEETYGLLLVEMTAVSEAAKVFSSLTLSLQLFLYILFFA